LNVIAMDASDFVIWRWMPWYFVI